MAVTYVDQTLEVWSVDVANPTIEHTVPAGDDRYLLLVCGWKYGAPDPSGATYDGNALTFLGTSTDPASAYAPQVFLYGIALGSSGSPTTADAVATVAWTWPYGWMVAINLTGVDQEDPTGAFESDGADSATISVDITTDAANSLLFGAGGVLAYAATITQDDGQTERWDTDTGGTSGTEDATLWGSQLAAPTAEEYSFGVTKVGTGYNYSAIAVVEVHEAAGGAPVEDSDTRGARTAGKVTDASDTRGARTAGKVTDASDTRAARTAGVVTDASDTRAARTAGKVTDASTARAARTKGQPPRDSFAGTVTYFMRGTWGGGGAGDDADHACIPGAYGYKLTKDDAAPAQVKDTVPGTTNDRICFSWTSETPEPPTPWALGDYRAQVDVTYIGPDIVFRIQLLRIKLTDCTVLETLGTSGNLSGTGLHLFSVEGINPGDTGRFQVRLIADNTNEAAQDIRCSVRGTNSWADGPWGYLDSDTRAARTAGKVTDASSTRAARTLGQVTDSSTRAARTAGKVTGASSVRGARAYGKSSAVSSTRAARTVGKVTPVLAQAEPFVPKDIRFSADTAKGLRDELNRVFAEITERLEVRTIVVRGVQFVPVRGPITKDEATPGLMYVREYEYDLDNDDDPLDCVHVVLPDSSETKSLGRIPLEAATVDGDGSSTTGGLRDD